ncbi:hypothetical protein GCM10022378_11740 [Salinicoccus jeotgali]|uniref:Uncharacterized protein n=1 Tax=Salinicoccus jeotgali TaxID=381634 RepID=A0ABP7EWA9_9STAP
MSEKDNKNKSNQKNSDKEKEVYTDPTILNSDTQFGGGGSADGSKK